MNYQAKADALFEEQKRSWPLLAENWEKLMEARLKVFEFEGYTIRVQYNPERIVSSAARVDRVSIENRKCFLCVENRPPEEKSVWFGADYEILCNPFPIFQSHYTIAGARHTPQVIGTEFPRFLDLSLRLPELVVFYNAPACGASAPDHIHFQAGSLGFMPLEAELQQVTDRYGHLLFRDPGLTVTAVEDGLRRFLLLESDQKPRLQQAFGHVYHFIRELQLGEEPMINMLSYYRDRWQILIFPRDRHRPWQYFEEGEENILLSPAAVDMGGTLITPLEKDFNKITPLDISDIFSQICFSDWHFDTLSMYMKAKLRTDA